MGQFQTIPINVVGGTHENRSRPVGTEKTVNMYMQVNEYSDKQTSLQSFYGQKLKSEIEGDVDRGAYVANEVAYRVLDNTLYRIDRDGVHVAKGVVTGSDRCIFADDGDNVVIVSDRVYVYRASNDSFQENTNENLKEILSVTVINSQFIYTNRNLSFVSQPGDPFDVSGLDAIAAESSPDNMIRDYAFNQTIYRFGDRTTELWYNSGVGSPPIERIEGRQFSVGCAAINSISNTDNALYWLGDDNCIYRVAGGTPAQRISDDALSNEIEQTERIDNAFGYAFTIQGQDFYLITFPFSGRTFVINEMLGKFGWFNLSSTTQSLGYSGTSCVEVYGKVYVVNQGKWLTLERDVYTQDTDTMLRQRTTGMIQAKDLNLKSDSMVMSKLYLDVEQGIGLITGQGEKPRLMVEVSIDGGRSFPHVEWMELGRQGENTFRTEVDLMIRGQSFIFRFNMSDPVPLTIKGGWLKVKGAGR